MQPAKKAVVPPTSINLIDTNFTFGVSDWARTHAAQAVGATPTSDRPITLAYAELSSALAEARSAFGLRTSEVSLATVSLDPNNRSQQKFPDALERMGYVVERLDYRHNYVSVAAFSEIEKSDKPPATSMAPSLAYVLGILTGQAHSTSVKPEVVVVTGGFDLHAPLIHFMHRTGGKVVLAFFRRFLDQRWAINGLFNADSPIKFYDLEPKSESLLGIDIGKLHSDVGARPRGGLASLF